MQIKSTWSELLYECQQKWIENNIHRKTCGCNYGIRTEHINNEIKLYDFSKLISTFKYVINLDNITTIYIENDDGYKTQFTLIMKENTLCHLK